MNSTHCARYVERRQNPGVHESCELIFFEEKGPQRTADGPLRPLGVYVGDNVDLDENEDDGDDDDYDDADDNRCACRF